MKQSIKDRVTFCKHCGTAYLIDVEGDHESCDLCLDAKYDSQEEPIEVDREKEND